MNTARATFTNRVITIAAALVAILVPAALAVAAHHHAPKTTTKRISVKANGREVKNSDNDFGSVSANGRFVTFEAVGKFAATDTGPCASATK